MQDMISFFSSLEILFENIDKFLFGILLDRIKGPTFLNKKEKKILLILRPSNLINKKKK
tara:strand:+ start:12383 stop:12559 length:177 start_codon:yes stop_codon:yes gene_type:complete